MKVSANFHLEEFVPKNVFKIFGQKALWQLDPRLIEIVQKIRIDLGRPIHINTWMDGGKYEFRGYRPITSDVGAQFSQHRRGCALDIDVEDMTNEEVFEFLMNHWHGYDAMGVTTLENPKFTPGWTHFDLRQKIEGVHPERSFLIVDPA